MTEHAASRTLVKSSPELWAECSDAALLGRHLDHFGEIRITRLEPEIAVAWEGERASGTVRLEPAGWGTRVVLTVRAESQEQEPASAKQAPDPQPASVEPEPGPEAALEGPGPEPWPPEPHPDPPEPEPEPLPPAAGPLPETRPVPARRRLLARMRAFLWPPDPELEPEPENPDELAPVDGADREPVPVPRPTLERLTPVPMSPGEAAAAAERKAHDVALTAALESLGQAHHRPFSRP